jgi:hypothetical protein
VRVYWRSIDTPTTDAPAVELELSNYRDVAGTRLPHQIRTFVGGHLQEVDTIVSCQQEAHP